MDAPLGTGQLTGEAGDKVILACFSFSLEMGGHEGVGGEEDHRLGVPPMPGMAALGI